MCLELYVAASVPIEPRATAALSVEPLDADHSAIARWLSLPELRYVGAHTGCSCGFPSVRGAEVIEYGDGFFDETEPGQRAADLASVRALFALIDEVLAQSEAVELLPLWWSDADASPKGRIHLRRADMTPETFFVNERYLHRVTR
jgi:hypothetical protein